MQGSLLSQRAVYAFTRNDYNLTQQQELRAINGRAGDFFGFSIALDGNDALVGVPNDDNGTDLDVGSAYFFTRSGSV